MVQSVDFWFFLLPVGMRVCKTTKHALRSWIVLAGLTAAGFALIVLPQTSNWLVVGSGGARWLAIAVIVGALAGVFVVAENVRRHRAAGAGEHPELVATE